MSVIRRVIRVRGVVQGVGFRPFVHGLALDHGISGSVRNDSSGVVVDAEGDERSVLAFMASIQSKAPLLSRIESVEVQELVPEGRTGFLIEPSVEEAGTTSIPPDAAVCDACLAELRNPSDRRHDHPFIACTQCGPRYTIVTRLPFDRPGTTMAGFPLCQACLTEYEDPSSRRFHAQPTACPDCGPRLEMLGVESGQEVSTVAGRLRAGGVVAIKGLGGYHLACDARNQTAVGELRRRKERGAKPFALMAKDVAVVQRIVRMRDEELEALNSPSAPIVLAQVLDVALRDSVAPGQATLGVMLPYTPLHHLLFDAGAPEVLVMTSGNLSDEPICIDPVEAESRLGRLADAFLHNDRPIHVPCDDSVVQFVDGGMQPVRRSRGWVPLPTRLPFGVAPLLAVGGELKATIAVAQGDHAWLSQHIGDTASLETLEVLSRTAATLSSLQRVEPQAIVSDMHPGYLSRGWAATEAGRRGVGHIVVQHHHAHLAALLADHGLSPDEEVLGFVFDGTGFGDDGTIWGGELLFGSYDGVRRVGRLRPIPLPGGDAAIKRPLRSALAHLWSSGLAWDPDLPPVGEAEGQELPVVRRMLETGVGCTSTSSVGRLFDAFASLLGVCHGSDYEAQAAMELQALAEGVGDQSPGLAMSVDLAAEGCLEIDPGPALASAILRRREGEAADRLARAFHAGLADAVVQSATRIRDDKGPFRVGLTGGVFVNRLLVAECARGLRAEAFEVLTHRQVPANDGGLALGQIAVAGRRLLAG